MCIIEVIVGGGVVALERIILKGGFNILPLSCIKTTFQYNALQ